MACAAGEAVDFHGRPAGREGLRPLLTKDGVRSFEVATAREAKGHLVATLKGIATREDAERLNGLELYVAREKLPATEEDEYTTPT